MRENTLKAFFFTFFYKITSRSFWALIITTAIITCVLLVVLLTPIEYDKYITWINTLLWIWGGTLFLYIGGNVFNEALAKMIEKAQLNLSGSTAKTIANQISGKVGGEK